MDNHFACLKNLYSLIPKTYDNKELLYYTNNIIDFIGTEISHDDILNTDNIPFDSPVFIIGCGCSGTSLCCKLLGNHSDIYCIPFETNVFRCGLDKNILFHIFKLFSYICIKNGKKLWCEKTPLHVHNINDIFEFFPNAKVIIMTRHGMAASSSLKYYKFNGNFTSGVKRWIKDNLVWINNMHKSKCLIIKYEDMIRNSLTVFHKLCAYVNIPFEDLSNTQHNTRLINICILPNEILVSSSDRINLRLWQINQIIYDKINESMTKMDDNEKIIFDNFVYDDHTTNDILEKLNYL